MPACWIEKDIHTAHADYLAHHGGPRPTNDASTHPSIQRSRIEQWADRWDILGIFDDAGESSRA